MPADNVSAVVPGVLTRTQMTRVVHAFRFAGVRLANLWDDVSVVSHAYACRYRDRFAAKGTWQVLFVDAGAAYVKCFLQSFAYMGNETRVQGLAVNWTERASGGALAAALAEARGIPLADAERELRQLGTDITFAKEEFDELAELLNGMMDFAGTVHEVQLYGGASQIRFVYEQVDLVVRSHPAYTKLGGFLGLSTNHVRRDFDANFGVVDAAAELIALTQKWDPHLTPVVLKQRPIVTYYAEWGDQTKKYCQRNFECRDPYFEFTEKSDIVRIAADARHVPFGAPTLANVFRLINISAIKLYRGADRGNLHLHLDDPDPVLLTAGYRNASGYYPIAVEPIAVYQEELNKSVNYFMSALRVVAPGVAEDIRRDGIEDRVTRLERTIAALGARKHKAAKEACTAWRKKLSDGTVSTMANEALMEATQQLDQLWRTITGDEVK
jgi:hypothetical protein